LKNSIVLIACILLQTAIVHRAEALVDPANLRGQGQVRYLGFIKVYDASLYTENTTAGNDILDPDVSKCLELKYHVSLTPENFIEGADTVMSRQHPAEYLDSIREEITLLHKAYQPVEEGDIYLLCYQAESRTTTLSLNDKELVAIQSAPFSSAYFGIWLGQNEPLDEDLQKDLINGTY
jgi:hypothetical protein